MRASEHAAARVHIWWFQVSIVAGAIAFGIAWGWEALVGGVFGHPYWLWFPISMVVGFAFHELLHAAILQLDDKVQWSDVRFGLDWNALSPFVAARIHVRATVFRASVIAPALFLGVVPGVIALLTGFAELFIWSVFMLAGCLNDVAVWRFTVGVEPSARLKILDTGGIEVLR